MSKTLNNNNTSIAQPNAKKPGITNNNNNANINNANAPTVKSTYTIASNNNNNNNLNNANNTSSNQALNTNRSQTQQQQRPQNINNNQNAAQSQQLQQQQQQQQRSQNQNNNNGSQSQRQISPTRFSDGAGTRIARRELWWKEPPPSQVKIQSGQRHKIENVTPKVDHRNPNYSPSIPTVKTIESQKLEWNAQSAVDTWSNINYQPGGGNKRYPSENLQWGATPKVDSGFLYTFQ